MISLVVVVDGDIDFIVLLYLVGVSGVLVNVSNYELGKRRHSGVCRIPYFRGSRELKYKPCFYESNRNDIHYT